MLKLQNEQKIYVNRSLNMESIKSIGFDMDHTLALYHREAFESLAFRETVKKFINAGYPKELEKLKFNPNFVIRGLLVDRDQGNLLKVDGHKYVKVAYHGHRRLEKKERHALYNAKGYKADEFLSIDTFFALSEVQLFTEIVDYMRLNPGAIKKSFREVYADLREFIDLSHKDGTIKRLVLENISKYIKKDKNLASTLVRLINGGKKLFLLTNSDWTYTNAVMSYLLKDAHIDFPNWQDFFAYVFVGSGKPNFFTGSNPFFEVTDNGLLKPHYGEIESGKIYHGGNARLFQNLTQQTGDEILYIGDHIYGDIMRSKELFNWRTLLVVEELSEEFKKIKQLEPNMKAISDEMIGEEELLEQYQFKSVELSELKRKKRTKIKQGKDTSQLEIKIADIEKELQETEGELKKRHLLIVEMIEKREENFHPIWGELMYSSLKKSRFARQVEGYACLYTTQIVNLRFYSPNQNFRSFRDNMPHDF